MTLIENRVEGKEIILEMDNNIEISEDFKAVIKNEGGIISINSDLTGLK